MGCPKLAEGDIVRITRVDDCGAPVEGADNAFVDDCWASVLMAPNVEAGTDIDFRAMNGRSCGFKRGCPSFRGFDLTGEFYSASPEMIEILTGNPVYEDFNGDPVGWDDCSIACASGFALEIWQNVVGEECVVGEEGQWFYWLLPWFSNGVLGDVTVGQEGVTFSLTGNTRASGGWSLGPWDVQDNDGDGTAGPLLTVVGTDCHRRGFLTTIAPPTAACSYVTVPANNTPGS
jgi:hypothetical protein